MSMLRRMVLGGSAVEVLPSVTVAMKAYRSEADVSSVNKVDG
jgi:hypothetical protein